PRLLEYTTSGNMRLAATNGERHRSGFVRACAFGLAAFGLFTAPCYTSNANGQQTGSNSVFWRLASYNSQAVTVRRSFSDILEEVHTAHILGVQGTGLRQSIWHPQEVFHKKEGGYHVYHFPAARSEGLSQSCAVSLAFRQDRFSEATIRAVYIPPEEFQGRVGAIRQRLDGAYDIAAFTVYIPPAGAVDPEDAYQGRLYQWIDNTVSSLPARTLPVFFFDANAHVGYEYDRTTRTCRRHSSYDAAGSHSPARQNNNGVRLRRFCNAHELALVNTQTTEGHGPTYTSPTGARTRVDYVAVPASIMPDVIRARVWYMTGYSLQLAHSMRAIDHNPVVVDLNYRAWFQASRGNRLNTEAMQQATPKQVRELQQKLDGVLTSVCSAIVNEADATAAVDQMWHVLISTLREVAVEEFSTPEATQFSYSAATRERGQQHRAVRQAVWEEYVRRGRSIPENVKEYVQDSAATLENIRKEERKQWTTQLEQQISQSLKTGNLRHVWRIAHTLAGTCFGPKNRRLGHVSRSQPQLADWKQYLEQPGPSGGCLAEVIKTSCLEPVDVPELAMQEGERYVRDKLPMANVPTNDRDYEGFHDCLRLAKSHRACPRWACPKEAWLLALKEGPYQTQFQNMLQQFFILLRRYKQQPQLWSISQTALLDKVGNKTGCKSKRVIHLLDRAGKAWNKWVWGNSSHAVPHWAVGFVPRRRRDQAILQLKCQLWRLHALGLGAVAVFYDVANAFSSTSFASLDRVLYEDCPDQDALLLTQRYRRALWLFSVCGQEMLISPRCGDLQGDTAAPQKFLRVYKKLLARWKYRTSTEFEDSIFQLRDPTSGKKVSTSMIAFADDLCRVTLCLSFFSFVRCFEEWNRKLDTELATAGLGQNREKQQFLCRPAGRGAVAMLQELQQYLSECSAQPYVLSDHVLYLGSQVHVANKNTPEVRARLQAARTHWRMLGRFWSKQAVKRRIRVLLYCSLVRNDLIRAAETLVLTLAEQQQLERAQTYYLRTILGKEALVEHNGQMVYRTSEQLRRQLQMPTLQSTLRVRRLLWLKAIVKHNLEAVLLLAVLLAPIGTEQQFDSSGRPTSSANPWLRQWCSDLAAYRCLSVDWAAVFEREGFFAALNERFLKLKFRKLQGYQLPEVKRPNVPERVGVTCEIVDGHGDACARHFETKQALVTHQRKKHAVFNRVTSIVVTNQCPWRHHIFSSRASARVHVQKRQLNNNRCPAATHNPRSFYNVLVVPGDLVCPLCSDSRETLSELHEHMVLCLSLSSVSDCSSSDSSE
ncbi:unnamed protein product, partial [Polarella glacialis]